MSHLRVWVPQFPHASSEGGSFSSSDCCKECTEISIWHSAWHTEIMEEMLVPVFFPPQLKEKALGAGAAWVVPLEMVCTWFVCMCKLVPCSPSLIQQLLCARPHAEGWDREMNQIPSLSSQSHQSKIHYGKMTVNLYCSGDADSCTRHRARLLGFLQYRIHTSILGLRRAGVWTAF